MTRPQLMWHKAISEAVGFLEELEFADLLPDPSPLGNKQARGIILALRAVRAQIGDVEAMHPLVRCLDESCGQEFTACDAGNHYCPSCGESSEGAPAIDPCEGCPCIEQGGPCCFCHKSVEDHA